MPHLRRRPLLVTSDSVLREDLLRLSAAAGAELEVAHEPSGARRSWSSAPLVVVGDDVAEALVRQALPRRGDVVIVGLDLDDAKVWARGVALGAEHVVFLPDAESWLADRLADAVDGGAATLLTISVLGGRGGAGASTLAAALAVTGMRRGMAAMLVDGDPLGGGIDLLLGGEDSGGLRWPDLAGTRGRVNGAALRDALPRVDQLTVLSWDRGDVLTIDPEAMQAVLGAAQRSSELVVPAEVRATASAARVAAAAGIVAADLRVVVRGPAPSGLPAEVVADALGLPLAGVLRPEPGLAAALERGEPPARRGKGPLAHFCTGFLAAAVEGRRAAA